jgi:hypothetical protein
MFKRMLTQGEYREKYNEGTKSNNFRELWMGLALLCHLGTGSITLIYTDYEIPVNWDYS